MIRQRAVTDASGERRPDDAVAFVLCAEFFEGLPDFGSFAADAYGNSFVELANGIDNEVVKFDTFFGGVSDFVVGSQFVEIIVPEVVSVPSIGLFGESVVAGQKPQSTEGDVFGF